MTFHWSPTVSSSVSWYRTVNAGMWASRYFSFHKHFVRIQNSDLRKHQDFISIPLGLLDSFSVEFLQDFFPGESAPLQVPFCRPLWLFQPLRRGTPEAVLLCLVLRSHIRPEKLSVILGGTMWNWSYYVGQIRPPKGQFLMVYVNIRFQWHLSEHLAMKNQLRNLPASLGKMYFSDPGCLTVHKLGEGKNLTSIKSGLSEPCCIFCERCVCVFVCVCTSGLFNSYPPGGSLKPGTTSPESEGENVWKVCPLPSRSSQCHRKVVTFVADGSRFLKCGCRGYKCTWFSVQETGRSFLHLLNTNC